jgi:hypothetical protein
MLNVSGISHRKEGARWWKPSDLRETFHPHSQILKATAPAEGKNIPVCCTLPTLKYEEG